jgi:hypothetical protein
VIVQAAEGKTLVYWGTPKVQDALEAKEWPGVYRERNEIQEHRFKDMIDHGALHTNYGRKTILGADRYQQRKQAQLAQSLETAHKRVDKKAAALKAQQDKVAESASKGHGKRLEQRRRTVLTLAQAFKEAKATQAKCSEQAATLGPAGQRADRDFRKQTIMTIRTLVLENWLRAFMGALAATLHTKVSLPQVLSLLFERSGSRLETPSQVLYWVNSAGLSDTVASAPGCPQKTFVVKCRSAPLRQEGNTMCGPGEYRPDPRAGITAPADLPQPEIVPYSRHDLRQPCPRCGPSAYRDKQSHRTLHDVGHLDVWCPRDRRVTYAQPYCTQCRKDFHADLSALAPPGRPYTHRVIDLAVRLVVEDRWPSRPASWHLWRASRVFVPCAPIQTWVEAGGKKGAGAHGHRLPGRGVGGFCGLRGRRCSVGWPLRYACCGR